MHNFFFEGERARARQAPILFDRIDCGLHQFASSFNILHPVVSVAPLSIFITKLRIDTKLRLRIPLGGAIHFPIKVQQRSNSEVYCW